MLDLGNAAARLALLAACAAVSRKRRIRGDSLRLPSSRDRFTPAAVVERLAMAPKPLLCKAREVGGSIELTYSPIAQGMREFDDHLRSLELDRERGGFMGYLANGRSGSDQPLVYCVGRDEALLLPLLGVEHWHRHYYQQEYVGWRGDAADNPFCSDLPEYIEARRQGAAGILEFFCPDDRPMKMYMIEKGEE